MCFILLMTASAHLTFYKSLTAFKSVYRSFLPLLKIFSVELSLQHHFLKFLGPQHHLRQYLQLLTSLWSSLICGFDNLGCSLFFYDSFFFAIDENINLRFLNISRGSSSVPTSAMMFFLVRVCLKSLVTKKLSIMSKVKTNRII